MLIALTLFSANPISSVKVRSLLHTEHIRIPEHIQARLITMSSQIERISKQVNSWNPRPEQTEQHRQTESADEQRQTPQEILRIFMKMSSQIETLSKQVGSIYEAVKQAKKQKKEDSTAEEEAPAGDDLHYGGGGWGDGPDLDTCPQ